MRTRGEAKARPESFLADPRMRAYLARTPLVLRGDDEFHVLVFRRIVETAMAQGRWAGQMGLPS